MTDPDWTLSASHAHLAALIAEVDRRNDQRFQAQEKAVQTAMTAYEKATNAALASSDKASTLAAQATKEHFAAVNGLQARMDNQARELISRNEALSEIKAARAEGAAATAALDAKLTDYTARADRADPLHALTRQVDVGAGQTQGSQAQIVDRRQSISTTAVVAGLVVSGVLLILAIATFAAAAYKP